MLAGLYARAGAMRGERVVYYGFEEPRTALLRNFRTIGLDMAAALDAGRASMAYEWLLAALHGFDRAISLKPAGNDDAVLRWNACVRAIEHLPAPSAADRTETAIMSE